MPEEEASGEGNVYGVVARLVRLRNVLAVAPCDFAGITAAMPGTYDDAAGPRRLRRDLQNLAALGYTVERMGRPRRWSISAALSFTSDEDVQAMVSVRDAFEPGHPHAPFVQRWLERLAGSLTDEQARIWARLPALRVPLKPAIDYTAYASLIAWLEIAIAHRYQIAFSYRSPGKQELVRHTRLDPYEIEYTDRHFYLLAYDHDYNSMRTFRIDRIVEDQRSPERFHTLQAPRREPKPIHFTYRLPASFADSGVSERFTIHAVRHEDEYVIVEASDPSEFRIIRTLLGYGENALLLDGPTTLLARMRERVMKLARQYEVDNE